MHHILVDYENLKSVEPKLFELQHSTVTLILGPQNKSIGTDVVESLMQRAQSVEFVRLGEPGRNAVDFALAYYLGRKVAADPTARFHIVSNDKGYDPLIKHLTGRNVHVQRHSTIAEVARAMSGTPRATPPVAKASASGLPAELEKASPSAAAKPAPTRAHATPTVTSSYPVDEAALFKRSLAFLQKAGTSRARRRKTLINQLQSQFGKGVTVAQVEKVLTRLINDRYVQIDEKNAVTYTLELKQATLL